MGWATAALISAPPLGGCGSDKPGGDASQVPLVVSIVASDGSAVDETVAIVTWPDGEIEAAACPGESAGRVECAVRGVRIADATGVLDLTAKARGYAFATERLVVAELAQRDGAVNAEVRLAPLPPFEANDDYDTGLSADAGLEAFARLAVTADSELGPTQVVKFYVTGLDAEPQVYLQNTSGHPLHYPFARDVLGVPLGLAEFEATTYAGADRTAFAGSLTYYPAVQTPSAAVGDTLSAPLILTFFPSDDLTPEQALLCHRLLEERLGFVALHGGERRLAYVPAGELQQTALSGAVGSFASRGAAWLTQQELYGNLSLQILNDGLAYGTLRLLTPEQLETSVVSFTDVLVLPRLPNSLPVVGGTITEELQTPLAHVNVAARTRGTPNIALVAASADQRVAPLLDRLVRFEVGDGTFRLQEATLDEAQSFWATRTVEPVVPTSDDTRDGLPSFDEIGFDDSNSVGVKAANLAELHQLLGGQAPHGFAVPFRYYDEFMSTAEVTTAACDAAHDECVASGRTAIACQGAHALCAAGPESAPETLWDHASRLLADPVFQSDSPLRDAVLAALRHHMTGLEVDPTLAAQIEARVSEIFGSSQVRIRSSTNTEDLPNFSGAGLYESVSAELNGRLPSGRIREVWASVWGWQAYEERSFWGIDHLAVRMGCALNPAIDDEAANGVLITQNISDTTVAGMYVNVQLGEVSVTNPTDGALPEIFSIVPSPTGIQVARQRFSSLAPEVPILTDSEVQELYLAAEQVHSHFAGLYGQSPFALVMELEFKFFGPGRQLLIKQARPYVYH